MKREVNRKLRKALGIMILVATLGVPLSSIAAPVGTVGVNPLVMARTAYTQKNYSKAVQLYSTAAKTDQYKNSSECRLGLGKSLVQLGTTQKGTQQKDSYKQAVKELRTARRLGAYTKSKQGIADATEANNLMISPALKNFVAPRMGADTPMIAMANGIRGMERGGEPSKPKVLEFYAPWCDPCNKLKESIAKAKVDYKDKVEFVSYNIDDPKSGKVVEDYEVSPIPTLIFLDSSNQVVSYSIGYSDSGLKNGMKKILPPV
jgi:thiol-disulfide isomerase/thioredoxin